MRTTTVLLLSTLTAIATGCGKTTPQSGGNSAPAPDTDAGRLQGEWVVTSREMGDPNLKGVAGDETKDVLFVFEGDKLRACRKSGETLAKFLVSLDPGATPKTVTLTKLTDNDGRQPQPQKDDPQILKWIYKFDGDVLVMCMSSSREGKRPTEFKTKPPVGEPGPAISNHNDPKAQGDEYVPAVDLWYLKKTAATGPAEKQRPSKPPVGTLK